MDARIKLERTMVAVEQGDSVHVMVEIDAPEPPAGKRQPLDIVAVIDRSGSMGGAPLEAAKDAVERLLRLVTAADRLGVVSYDDEVQLVLGLRRHDTAGALRAVHSIWSGGSTNLAGGWLKGFELLAADGRADALRTVLLLTDGHANVGITEAGELAGLAASAQRTGVRTSTVGFAEGFDEELLAAMADAGHGNAHFAGSAEDLPAVFATEFEDLGLVVAHNVSIEIRLHPDVAIVEVFGDRPLVPVERGVQITLGDAYGGESRRLVFALGVPGLDAMGPVTVAEVVLRYVTVGDGAQLHTVTMPVVVNIVDANAVDGADPEVTEEVLRLRAAQARSDARERLRNGDVAGAAATLRESSAMLRAAAPSIPNADELRAEADELVAQAEAFRSESAAYSRKSLYHRSRSQYQGRRKRPNPEPPTR